METTLPGASAPLYDDAFAAIVRAAAERLTGTLARETPALGTRVLPWIARLTRGGGLADYYMHPRRFPMLLLPWWAAEGTPSRGDRVFHEDLALGTMAGYCFVRLLDDLVDAGGTEGLALLPAAGVFHLEFQSAYQRHFAADHPLWALFRQRWLMAADATVAPLGADDAALDARAEATLGPVLIPLAAACHHGGVAERFDAWRPAVLKLARLEQFLDDVVDWQADAERGQPNLVLAEASGRARPGEPLLDWIVREGYARALDTARARVTAAARSAAPLGSPALDRFIVLRGAMVDELEAATAPGLQELARLARAFGAASA